MEFMHSSFSQTGSRFFDRGLLLGITSTISYYW